MFSPTLLIFFLSFEHCCLIYDFLLYSGLMGNLDQVQVLLYLATSQEMVRKKRSFKVREKSGNLIEVGGNLCFSETLGRIYIFYQFRYLSRFFIDMKCKQIGFPKTKL